MWEMGLEEEEGMEWRGRKWDGEDGIGGGGHEMEEMILEEKEDIV